MGWSESGRPLLSPRLAPLPREPFLDSPGGSGTVRGAARGSGARPRLPARCRQSSGEERAQPRAVWSRGNAVPPPARAPAAAAALGGGAGGGRFRRRSAGRRQRAAQCGAGPGAARGKAVGRGAAAGAGGCGGRSRLTRAFGRRQLSRRVRVRVGLSPAALMAVVCLEPAVPTTEKPGLESAREGAARSRRRGAREER